jgi:S-adenosyl-L-methionine hydrolase (adenosine-forming)
MPCITLLSDLGLRDAPVAIARGVMLQHAPGATLVDISHELQPFNTQQAAYLLMGAWKNFAPGTVHVLVFDLFYDRSPRVVLSEHEGHYFVCPDNGLLPMALGRLPERSWLCMELDQEDNYAGWLHAAGRAIAMLATTTPDNAGMAPYTLKPAKLTEPTITGNIADCGVLHIDQYENVVTNMSRQRFDELNRRGRFTVQVMRIEEVRTISAHYNDVRHGYTLCRFNSRGFLEVCVNHGNAAGVHGIQMGSIHNDIKILIE